MNVFAFLLALTALQGVLAAYPESLPAESGEPARDEKNASARGGKPLRGDAEETQRGLGGGWGGSKDTDSPTMFPTLAPTISPTLSPTLFPTVSPTFCGKAGKASGDYYYSGKSSKSSGSRMAGAVVSNGRSARDRARARKEVRERERQAAYDRAMSMWVAEGSEGTPPALRNSKSSKSGSGSKSGKSEYYYSGKASGDDCTQGSRDGGKSGKSDYYYSGSKSSKSGSRRALRAQEGASDPERSAPSEKFEPDSVRRRRVNRAS